MVPHQFELSTFLNDEFLKSTIFFCSHPDYFNDRRDRVVIISHIVPICHQKVTEVIDLYLFLLFLRGCLQQYY